MLGRQIDGVAVDIDLGMEGRANMISRHQAIIKMDEDGTFYMKNLGKLPIYVGEHEYPKANACLPSYCLIQIRGMSFMFVSGEAHVKQYLSNDARKS